MSRAVLLILYLFLVTPATTQSDASGCTSSAIVKLQASLDDQARLLRCLLAGDNDSPVCASAVTCKVSSINVYAHSLHTEVCMVGRIYIARVTLHDTTAVVVCCNRWN